MDTKAKILDVAEAFIKERGYKAFSFRDIAAEVGMKSASVHYHYPNKSDLVSAVVERYRERFFQQLAEINSSSRKAKTKLEKYGQMFIASYSKGSGYCLCATLANDRNNLESAAIDEVCNFFRLSVDWLEAIFADGMSSGEFKIAGAPRQSASAVVSLFEGALLSSRAQGSDVPLREAYDWLMAMVEG